MSDRRDDFRREADNPLKKYADVWWQLILGIITIGVMFVQHGYRLSTIEKEQTALESTQANQAAILNSYDKQLALLAQDIGYIKQTVTSTDKRLRQRGAGDQ